MRALLVGAGGMGKAWGRNLLQNPRTELVGWVDVREGAAQAALAELGVEGAKAGADLTQMAKEVVPDFVVDVTPPEAHYGVTLIALGLGLPIIGEKPLAANLQQAREMVAASKASGKLYMVSQSRRYSKGMATLKQAADNLVGKIGILNADFYVGAHFGGFRDEMESPLLLDMAIHTFDQARFLSGCDPISVVADEWNAPWSWYRGNACASAIFEFSDGVRFTYRGSWCTDGLPTAWDGNWRLGAERGSILWENDGEVVVERIDTEDGLVRQGTKTIVEPIPVAGGIADSLDEFLDALETGTEPSTVCHDNIKSLAMVFAAKEAAQTGRRVPVEW